MANPILMQEFLTAFIDMQPFPAALYDDSFHFVKANRLFIDLFGYSETDLPHLDLSSPIHPKDSGELQKHIESLRQGSIKAFVVDATWASKSHPEFRSMVIVQCVNGESTICRNYMQTFLIGSDPREEKRLDGGPQFAFVHSPAGMAVISPETGCFLEVNSSYAAMHGYSPEEMAGMDVLRVYPEASQEQIFRIVNELRRDRIKAFAVQHRRKDGSLFWADIHAAYGMNNQTGRPALVAICKDISLVRDLERARDEALRQAEAANKAKSDFLSNMSHEIRTPMNGVMGMIELALMEDLPPRARKYLSLSKTSAVSLLQIINDILDFSKIEAGRIELHDAPFSPRETVGSIIETFKPVFIEKGIGLELDIAPDVPDCLSGDAGRLRQVLVNLIDNAFKFTDKGLVRIAATMAESGEPMASDTVQVLFSVSDTGVGIASDKLRLIFQSFSQVGTSAHVRYGGTGLGLSISKTLVELMGGTIWVESAPGMGSTFYCKIPFRTFHQACSG